MKLLLSSFHLNGHTLTFYPHNKGNCSLGWLVCFHFTVYVNYCEQWEQWPTIGQVISDSIYTKEPIRFQSWILYNNNGGLGAKRAGRKGAWGSHKVFSFCCVFEGTLEWEAWRYLIKLVPASLRSLCYWYVLYMVVVRDLMLLQRKRQLINFTSLQISAIIKSWEINSQLKRADRYS